MHICVWCIHIRHLHTYIYTYICIYLHICIHIHIHIHIHICIYAYTYTYIYTHIYTHIFTYVHINVWHTYKQMYICIHNDVKTYKYGVATISRRLKIIGLFCKRAICKRQYLAKETCNSKEPTNRSQPIWGGYDE